MYLRTYRLYYFANLIDSDSGRQSWHWQVSRQMSTVSLSVSGSGPLRVSVRVVHQTGHCVSRVLHSENDLIDHWGRMLKLLFVNYPATLSWFDPDLPWFHVCQVPVGRDCPLELLFTILSVTVLILQQINALAANQIWYRSDFLMQIYFVKQICFQQISSG